MSKEVLELPKNLQRVFIEVMEQTDEAVLSYIYQMNAAKLEEIKTK